MSGVRGELEAGTARALAGAWLAAWNGDRFDACCTPDVGYEDPLAVEPLEGPAALTEHVRRVRRAFPDLRLEAAGNALADGRFACVPWRAAGTHRGEEAGVPPTGRFLTLHGVHYVELSDGLVRRARGFFDLYAAAGRLGLAPPRGSLGESAALMLRGFGLRARR